MNAETQERKLGGKKEKGGFMEEDALKEGGENAGVHGIAPTDIRMVTFSFECLLCIKKQAKPEKRSRKQNGEKKGLFSGTDGNTAEGAVQLRKGQRVLRKTQFANARS